MPHSQRRMGMVAGVGALLVLASLVTAPVANAAPRPKPGPVRHRVEKGRATLTGLIGVTGAPLAELVVSSSNLAFASNPTRNEVEVVNLQNATLGTPIAVGSQPKGLDLSADGSTLYVADSGGAQVSVVDVATRLETHRITIPSGFGSDTPFSIAVANNGKAFLSTTFAGSGFGARMLEINLSTEAVKTRSDFFLGSTTEDTHLAASADRSHIGVVAGDISSGPVFMYTAATDTFTPEHDLNTFVDIIALDHTGSQVLVGPGSFLLDGSLTLEGTIPGGGLGMAVAASGKTAYRVQSNLVEVIDLVRQRVVATIPLPEGVGSSRGAIGVSIDGATLAVLTATGVSLVAVADARPVGGSCSNMVTGTPPAPEVAHICGAPLAAIVVDGAGHAFASNPSLNEVEVVDLATGALEAPIPVGSQPKGLDLSPDGSTLYVADSGSSQVSVVNVATRSESHRITIAPASFFNDRPLSIAVANNGKAMLSTTFAGSGFGARVLEINLSTEAVQQRNDFFIRGTTTEDTHLASSADHSHIGAVAGDISSGPVFMYTAATDTWSPEHDLNVFVNIIALDHTGSRVLVDPGTFLLDGVLNLLGTIPGGGLGVAVAPSGTTAYRVQSSVVEIIDLSRQLVTGTIPLPEAVGSAPGGIAVSPDGTTLAVLTASGISLVSTIPTLATTTVTTTASGPGRVGGTITDTAMLSGGATPTGTITFQLFGPNDTTNCSRPAMFTSTRAVSGNGSYASDPFAPTSAGTYRWVASYSGDGANKPAGPTACGDPAETVTVTAPHTTLRVTAGTTSGSFPLTVHYSYKETNDGGDPISGVAVTDTGCTPVTFVAGPGGPGGTLQPGATWTYTCARTFTQPGRFAEAATATGTDVTSGMPAPRETASASVTVGCDRVVTGRVRRTIIAGPGATCIVGADVTGTVYAPPGSAIFLSGSSIRGTVVADRATAFTLCGTNVTGSLVLQATSGFVTIGDPGDDNCAGNTIAGTVLAAGNRAGLEVVGNRVGASLLLLGTTGAGPFMEDAQAEIEHNHLGATIWCGTNTPPPTNDGNPNTVGGARLGQCAAPGF